MYVVLDTTEIDIIQKLTSIISSALMIYLTCTPTQSGLYPSGLVIHIRQITWAHDTTSQYNVLCNMRERHSSYLNS